MSLSDIKTLIKHLFLLFFFLYELLMVLEQVDNSLRDQHNSSHHTKADVNNCFIVHSKYFGVLNKKSTSSKTSGRFLGTVSGYKQMFSSCK